MGRDEALSTRDELRVCGDLVDELLSDIRAVVSELRRHDGLDLAAAIAHLVRPIPGTQFELDVDPGLRVARVESAEILLRCAQEGITNALRHARPRSIALHCLQCGDRIVLTVRNDGTAPRALRFGNGLNGMHERLREVGGELSLRALPGGGAELVASLPVAA
jgi:signal transduction histidine kinase